MLRIALTTRVVEAPNYAETRDALANDWTVFFDGMGWLPIIVPNGLHEPQTLVRETGVQGIILTGGNTVSREDAPDMPGVAPARDRTEGKLLEFAMAEGVPVLGVCRGLQFINRYFGGDLTLGVCGDSGHVGHTHAVNLEPVGWPGIDASGAIEVNSFHDDGVLPEQVAQCLKVFATSADGRFVEGLIHKENPILAIQWHPERTSPSATFDQKLLRTFFESPKGSS